MSKVITFSRHFQKSHPKKGQPTFFVEKLINEFKKNQKIDIDVYEVDKSLNFSLLNEFGSLGCKKHTIRAGNRFKEGDFFSPRVWLGKPYSSKQMTIADDIKIVKVYDFQMVVEDDDGTNDWVFFTVNGEYIAGYSDKMKLLSKNDGFDDVDDFIEWFVPYRTNKQKLIGENKIFTGQVICWSSDVIY